MTNCNANATNSIAKPTNSTAKPTNSIAKPTNSIANGTNSIAKTCNTLTVDCLLGVDYLTANEVIIDYKHNHVAIRGHIIPFTLKNGIANTIQFSSNNAIASSLKTTTIPGRTIQLIDVQLPDGVAQQNFSSVLIDL